ncbi:MAG: rhodanese [Methylophaga sp.]|nr:rhodanese-like domain-containing protein [Gammaproteobacteria bacterium]PHS69142.1 MAG: rhodanese [Methylophaga sp.]
MAKTAIDLVQEAKAIITEISVEQANNMLADNGIALDVRELKEYESAHIANAHHISRGMLEFMVGQHPAFQDKDASIVVYCKSGGRSALATVALKQLGFSNVYSMSGGFDEWNDQ